MRLVVIRLKIMNLRKLIKKCLNPENHLNLKRR